MEEEWYADRSRLRALLRERPDWPASVLAGELGRSVGWVKKWKRRLREAPPDDEAVLRGHSRARRHPPPSVGPAVVARILAIRDDPPANLQRVPGPKAILYYLGQDADLGSSGARLPRSTRTIWRILVRHGRIARPARREREPLDRPPPLAHWQLDFKDVTSVLPEPGGKRAHVVEALNCVDCGTSLVVATEVRGDFTEETAVAAVADVLRAHGVPRTVTVDRDTRFVGSPGGRDFPAPFVRFLTCLGVEVDVCPPRRPQKNCYVERYHGTLERECLAVHRPATLEQARAATDAFRQHYNHERPNQATSCGNRPPRAAFPELPTLPALPERVDSDRWLVTIHGRRFVRKVRRDGSILMAEAIYYVKQALAGQQVTVEVDAHARTLVIRRRQEVLKRPPIKGLRGELMAFGDYLALMQREARSDWRVWLRRGRAA
jgi:transposase InsO family protein